MWFSVFEMPPLKQQTVTGMCHKHFDTSVLINCLKLKLTSSVLQMKQHCTKWFVANDTLYFRHIYRHGYISCGVLIMVTALTLKG